MDIKVTCSIPGSEKGTRILERRVTDCREYIKRSKQYVDFLSAKRLIILYGSMAASVTHTTYHSDIVDIYVWVWPNGELLSLPLVNDYLIIHYNQYSWLKYYPFLTMAIKGSSCRLEREYFQDYCEYENIDFVGSRDHWGHFFLDFFGQRLNSNILRGSEKRTLLEPLDRFRESIVKGAKYLDTNFEPEFMLPIKKSKVIRCYNVRHTSMSPGYMSLIRKIESPYDQYYDNLVYLRPKDMFNRVINLNEIDNLMKTCGAEIVDPVQVSMIGGYAEIYKEGTLVVSYHGSAMLNPLVFSNCNIIGLFPDVIFSEYSDERDLMQYANITLLFGTRIIPVFGKAECEISRRKALGPNEAINMACRYDTNIVKDEIRRLMSR